MTLPKCANREKSLIFAQKANNTRLAYYLKFESPPKTPYLRGFYAVKSLI